MSDRDRDRCLKDPFDYAEDSGAPVNLFLDLNFFLVPGIPMRN